ncbi:MAG: cyclic nucleotide-binding domain-containing protein, partial [Armatimonadetes bacterium]|nr:cyclic nucleotide-binding domain-containing protein [Armatimonadota bacterium]
MPEASAARAEPPGGAERLREAVKAVAAPIAVEAGQTVVHQGDAGVALYVVGSGALDVVVDAGADVRLPVARLGPGTHFGEMSLLTGTPVSADVVACEPTVLYAAGEDEFRRLVERDPELLGYLAGELAVRLQRTNERLAVQQQHQAALGRLIASPRGCPLKADLPSLARSTFATDAAADDRPVLITGEEGVGKRALARHIHSLSRRADRALLVVDCASLTAEEARQQLFGDAEPTRVTRFAERLGFLQAADGGTLVLADVDRLPPEVQADLADFAATPHSPGSTRVSVRLIATAACSLAELKDRGALHPSLADALGGGHVTSVAPLRKRRRDIMPLAEHLLQWTAQRRGQPAKGVGESARRELQGYDFPFGNAAELQRVVELAASLAEGEAVSAEHLFFGPTGAEAPQIDLLRRPWAERAALEGRLLGWLKAVVAIGFAGIVVACLLAPQLPVGRFANLLVWGVWWPGLIASLLLLGRAWCAVCPLSSGAEAVQRACGRNRAPSDRLSQLGPALALVGFVGIVWVEEATGMTHHPVRTALLLISLALAAALVGWL